MSSKIVRMLLRATEPGNNEVVHAEKSDLREKNSRKHDSLISFNTANQPTEKDLIALQVDKMLSLDRFESNQKIRKPCLKKRRTKETPKDSISAIVTNSRGSAMQAKRIFVPTYNKRKDDKEKKQSYFKKLAKKMQVEQKQEEKRKRKRIEHSAAQEK